MAKKMITTEYLLRYHKEKVPAGGIKAAFLTDMHNCCTEKETEVIFSALDAYHPDLIFCGGDMIVGKPGHSVIPALTFMKRLVSAYQVFCGTGNHEYRTRIYPETYGTMYHEYTDPLREAGVCFLENQQTQITVNGIPLLISGFDLDRKYYGRLRKTPPFYASSLTELFGDTPVDVFSVLLAHNPAQLKAYQDYGADLTLCGHYHGGIMRLPGNRGLLSPSFRPFPKEAHGEIRHGDTVTLIGAGLGEHTIPLRIRNPRELVLLHITNEK